MLKKNKTLIFIILLSILGQIPVLKECFIWDLNLIKSGEVWRIVTSTFTHTNLNHLVMNLTAVVLCFAAFGKEKANIGFVLYSSFLVGIVLCFLPEYKDMTYAGLSGMIHGLVVVMASNLKKPWFILTTFLIVLKVIFDTIYGSPTSSELINAKVAYESHIIGLISGLSYLLVFNTKKKKMSLK